MNSMLEGWKARLDTAANTEEASEEAIKAYKFAKDEIANFSAPWEDLQKRAKNLLTEIMTETGRLSIKTASGQAYVPSASKTVSYDAAALDALCASSEAVKAMLWPHRTEKERPGSLTIR